ncbi:DUF1003 domain-containing protein [Cellvibrio mixtus]|uniref:DUF1003 domain-containing protein n=1 Tax=Cellvibrio mixtus TaxID=39650 RepID=UPI00058798D2|nr:DUF1003 domain-containing protein [Cellvibrio mixtus]
MKKINIPFNYFEAATRWFGRSADKLDHIERSALEHVIKHQAMTEDPTRKLDQSATLGERLADRVAAFGGSWLFIGLFGGFMISWAILNTEILGKTAFDPYPYVFLNLVLSMLAAVQAPVILMSQNRQSAKDRQITMHDYEVNLKAEIEIMALHDKLDALRGEHLTDIINQQQKQIELLTQLLQSEKRQGEI